MSQQNEVVKSHSLVSSFLFLGLAIAIGGNIYESMRREDLARDLARAQVTTTQQLSKLNDSTKAAASQAGQRFDTLESQVETATTDVNLRQLRAEIKKSTSQVADGAEQKRQQLISQLADLGADTNEKLVRVSGDLENTGADVKRVEGDLNTISSTVATNSQELAALKELGERSYFEFNLAKTTAIPWKSWPTTRRSRRKIAR
jgi:exonuclease VII large subunit